MRVKWVCELPAEIQDELKADALAIMRGLGFDDETVAETIDAVMREKLINVIGDEVGQLPADKYLKYVL